MANPKAFTPAQIEKFERGADHYYTRWVLDFDPKTTTFDQLFEPNYFRTFAKKLEKSAIIRVLSADGSIDFDLTVVGKRKRGDDDYEITVRLRPRITQAVLGAAAAAERGAAPLAAIAAA